MTNAQKNKIIDKSFQAIGVICTFFGLVILAILIYNIIIEGAARIDWDFMKDLPSRRPQKAGIYTAVMGTIWILVLTTLIAFPVGVGAGIYLEEYGKKTKLASLLEINIANLAGVPSIIYGLLGLEIFVRIFGLGGSVLAGRQLNPFIVNPSYNNCSNERSA